MFGDSVLSFFSNTSSKTECKQEYQRPIAILQARRRSRSSEPKLMKPEAESDKVRDFFSKRGTNNRSKKTMSTKDKAPSPNPEVGETREDDDNDLIKVRARLGSLRTTNNNMSELADAKVSAERYQEDYERERNARKMVEDICTAMEKKLVANQKKFESMNQEVEMMKIGAQIRENALEMKLEDARLMLEKKYDELDHLQHQLEVFVRKNRSNDAPKSEAIQLAENLLEEIFMARHNGV